MSEKKRFVGAGAGPGGLHIARRLAEQGHEVDFYEAREYADVGHDVWDDAENLEDFHRLGIDISEIADVDHSARFRINGPGNSFTEFSTNRGQTVAFHQKELRRVMYNAARAAGANIHYGARVEYMRGDVVKVEGRGEEQVTATISATGMEDPANREGIKPSEIFWAYRAIHEPGGRLNFEVPERDVYMMSDMGGAALALDPDSGLELGRFPVSWHNRALKSRLPQSSSNPEFLIDTLAGDVAKKPTPGKIKALESFFEERYQVPYGEKIHSGVYPVSIGPPVRIQREDGTIVLAGGGNGISGSGTRSIVIQAEHAAKMMNGHDYGEGIMMTDREIALYNAQNGRDFAGEYAGIRPITLWQLWTDPDNVKKLIDGGVMDRETLQRNLAGLAMRFDPISSTKKMLQLIDKGHWDLLLEMAGVVPEAMFAKLIASNMPKNPAMARVAGQLLKHIADHGEKRIDIAYK